MCGSHNGELVHLRAVRSILERAGLTTEALQCPLAWPLDANEARQVHEPRPEYHNCSGKHAGMLLACSRRGFPMTTYPRPDHPLQGAVRDAVGAAAGRPPEGEGVDGCGVPVHLLPLSSLARMYAALMVGDRVAGSDVVVRAMRAEPYLVAGRDRVCTAIMESAPGVIVKVGAEGLMCAAVPSAGLGVAVRVEDGSMRAGPPAIVRALALLGAVDVGHPALAPFVRPHVVGGGERVGELVSDFDLQKARTMSG
jgi:L-asparaginase II